MLDSIVPFYTIFIIETIITRFSEIYCQLHLLKLIFVLLPKGQTLAEINPTQGSDNICHTIMND